MDPLYKQGTEITAQVVGVGKALAQGGAIEGEDPVSPVAVEKSMEGNLRFGKMLLHIGLKYSQYSALLVGLSAMGYTVIRDLTVIMTIRRHTLSSKSLKTNLQLLTIAVALFFIITGFVSIMNYDNPANQFGRAISSVFGNGGNQTLALIVAIAQLIVGVILLIDVFLPIRENTMAIVKLIIFAAWAAYVVVAHFLNNFMEPDFLRWFQPFTSDLVILAVLWVIRDSRV
jgi:uncharacterized membrane protein YphA (DoxX/SURF4 family)